MRNGMGNGSITGNLGIAGTITSLKRNTGAARTFTISADIDPDVTNVGQNGASTTMVLSGTNSYTGATTAKAGRLVVDTDL